MSSDHDPVRMDTDPSTAPWLRSLLLEAKAEASSAVVNIDHLTTRVEAAIVAELTLPDTAPGHRAPFGKLATGKAIFGGAGVVVGMVVGSVWMLKTAPRQVAPPVASSARAVASSRTKPLVPDLSPTLSATVAHDLAATPSTPASNRDDAPVPQASTLPTKVPSPVRDNRSNGSSEAALLDSARAALSSDPRRALALTQEHARRFPHGALAQEREVIAIAAMSRLGQTDAARSRAGEFERHFPGSAHQPKVDQSTRGP